MTGHRVVTEQEVPVERVMVEPSIESDHTEHSMWSRFSLGQVLHAASGVFLVVFGAIGAGRAGFGDHLGERTADVMGITLSTVLALAAIGAGLVLLLAALTPAGRGTGAVIGALLLVGGIIVAAGSDELLSDLHTESSLGWIGIITGAVAILGAFMPSHVVHRHSDVVAYH